MNLEELSHICRAIHNITGETEFDVFGSQSILGSYYERNFPRDMFQSNEVDICCTNNPDASHKITGALGPETQFDVMHKICADGIFIEELKLPYNYRKRMVTQPVPLYDNNNTVAIVHFLSVEDAITGKLAAYRPKDIAYIRAAKDNNVVNETQLEECCLELDPSGRLFILYTAI